MRRRRDTCRCLAPAVLLLGLLLVGGPMAGSADAKGKGWRERFKQGVERARNFGHKVKERARDTSQRARESWKRAAPKAREQIQRAKQKWQATKQRARETWQRTKQKATEVGHKTRERYQRWRAESLPRLKDWGRRSKEKLSRAMKRLDPAKAAVVMEVIRKGFADHGPWIQARIANLYADGRERLLPQMKQLATRYGGQIARHLGDPEAHAKAMDGLAAALDMYDRVHTMKNQVIGRALDVLGNQIPITVGGRTGTLNELGGTWVTKALPCLEGTSFATEPVQAITATFVMKQPDHVLEAIPLVAKNLGAPQSIREVLTTTSSSDTSSLLATLDVASKAMAVRKSLRSGGEGLPTAAMGLAAALRDYRS